MSTRASPRPVAMVHGFRDGGLHVLRKYPDTPKFADFYSAWMSFRMPVDPYRPPKAAVAIFPDGTEADCSLVASHFPWKVVWALLQISFILDIGLVARRLVLNGNVLLVAPSAILGLIALAQVIMVFTMRWAVFRLILRRRRPGDLRGMVPTIWVLVIFGMVKCIEYQGFRLWSSSGSIMQFLLFLGPSLVLAVPLTPARLVKFHMRGRQA